MIPWCVRQVWWQLQQHCSTAKITSKFILKVYTFQTFQRYILPPSWGWWVSAASACETSMNFYQTIWLYNREDSHLPTRRHKNLKFYLKFEL
jgi:hypothetical protein